jgi:ribosomal protein S18 acetylase RimI-like enzyme
MQRDDMSAAVEIRRELRPDDLDAIVALHARHYPAEYGVDSEFVSHVAARVAEAEAAVFPRERDAVWIVERDGEVAGSLVLTDEGDGTGYVRWYLLDPGLRGRGLGRMLVDELVEKARREGYDRLHLETFSDLRTAAAIYREAGFRVVAEETGPRWGRPSITYQRYERGFQRRAQARSSTRAGSSSRPFSVSA